MVAYDLLKTPNDYVAHFERYATSVVSIIGFGRRVSNITDPIITEVIALMHRAAALNVPGKTFPMLMETFPCRCPLHFQEKHFIAGILTKLHSPGKISDGNSSLEAWFGTEGETTAYEP